MPSLYKIIFIICLAILSCSTGYKRSLGPFENGYSESKTNSNIYVVTFYGNRHTSIDKVKKQAYERAAEVTLMHNYECFEVIKEDSISHIIYFVKFFGGDTVGRKIEYEFNLTIKFLKENSGNSGLKIFNASELFSEIENTRHHGLHFSLDLGANAGTFSERVFSSTWSPMFKFGITAGWGFIRNVILFGKAGSFELQNFVNDSVLNNKAYLGAKNIGLDYYGLGAMYYSRRTNIFYSFAICQDQMFCYPSSAFANLSNRSLGFDMEIGKEWWLFKRGSIGLGLGYHFSAFTSHDIKISHKYLLGNIFSLSLKFTRS
jgi:hypothetical protein